MRRIKPSLVNWKIIITMLALVFLVLLPSCTLPVDPCSKEFLVNAINSANSTPATIDTIELAPGCLYQLDIVDNSTDGDNGLPSIVSPIIINGHNATIRRSLSSQKQNLRLFHVDANGSLTLNDVTLLDGLGMNPPDVSLPIVNWGGAIFNRGQVSINNSQLQDNRAALRGGAIYNAPGASLSINNTTVSGSQALLSSSTPGESGGAIFNEGTATIANSTFNNNIASHTGGAIANSGTMSISNSTFSANVTNMLGGAAIVNSGTLAIEYTTIAFNIGGDPNVALLSATNTLQISNSIIANNAGQNCSYPATSAISEANISNDSSCNGFTITDDPQLQPLANNGGPTMTHAIGPSSPAKNAATGSCPAADQRGEPRPHGPACDLGAYEIGSGPLPTNTSAPGSGSISGWTYIDGNDNGVRDAAEVTDFVTGAMLTLAQGTCPGTSTITSTESSVVDGSYSFLGLPAGTYCILTSDIQQTLDPTSQTVVVGDGENVMDINFRYVPSVMPTSTFTITPTSTFTLTPTATFTPTNTFIPPTYTFTPTSTATATPVTARIKVYVWKDSNGDGKWQNSEDAYAGVRVYVGTGSCNDRAMGTRTETTKDNGVARFTDIPMMTYCVYTEIVPSCGTYSSATTPEEITIVVDHGGTYEIYIGYSYIIC